MRRVLLVGLPVLALLGGGAVAYHYLHHGNLLQDAQQRFARGDVYGAELDLDSYLRRHPDDPIASFRLGLVNLAEDNAIAAERNFHHARDAHYDPKALILPLGEAYLRQHHYDQALAEFTMENAPKGAEAAVLAVRASAYLGLKQVDEARQAAAAGVAAAPDSPDALLVAARVALNTGDIKSARDFVDRALARDPKRADSLLLKAELAVHDGDPATAYALAEQVLQANPVRLDAKMAAARALAAEHKDVEAARLVDEVLKRAPHQVGANYLRVVLAVRQRDFATADASLEVISSVIDELPQGDYFLAVTKLGRNQPAQAQEAATKFVARNPNDLAGLKLLAFAELALRRPDNANAVLKQIMARGAPDADTLDLLARAQALNGNIKGAEHNLAAAAAIQPGNTDVLNRLAAAKLGLGDIEAGKADLRRSLAATPDQPLAALTLVQTSLAQGDLAGAHAVIDTLRKAVGDTELVGVLDAQEKVAKLDLEGAKALYQDVLKRFPSSRDATFGLIQVEGRLGDAKTAQDRLSGWMAMHPSDKTGLRLLVKSLLAEGDKKGAVTAAEAAHAANPTDTEITGVLATLYDTNKQPDEAVSLLERVEGGATGQLAVLRGEALMQAGKPDDALAVLQAAVAGAPRDLAARFALAQLDARQNKTDDARQVLTDGLQILPGNPQLLQGVVALDLKAHGIKAALATAFALQKDPANLPAALQLPGNALLASGDTKGAADAYVAAYRQAPSLDLALASAGALIKADRRPEARTIVEGWTAQHPDDVGPLEVLASLDIVDGRLVDAGPVLEQVLKLRPNSATSLNNLAWVKLQRGDVAGANGDAMRSFYLSPGPETQDTLGWTLVKLGKYDQALGLLVQAAAAKPTPGILYHYAAALQGAGRATEAKAAIDKSLADGKPFDERGDAEALRRKLSQ